MKPITETNWLCVFAPADNLPRDDRKALPSGCHSIPADCIGDVTGVAAEGVLGPTLKNPSINLDNKAGPLETSTIGDVMTDNILDGEVKALALGLAATLAVAALTIARNDAWWALLLAVLVGVLVALGVFL
jgi:hypothetical protein